MYNILFLESSFAEVTKSGKIHDASIIDNHRLLVIWLAMFLVRLPNTFMFVILLLYCYPV